MKILSMGDSCLAVPTRSERKNQEVHNKELVKASLNNRPLWAGEPTIATAMWLALWVFVISGPEGWWMKKSLPVLELVGNLVTRSPLLLHPWVSAEGEFHYQVGNCLQVATNRRTTGMFHQAADTKRISSPWFLDTCGELTWFRVRK